MKKLIAILLTVVSVLSLFAGCGSGNSTGGGSSNGLKVAVLEGVCDADTWELVCDAFEAQTGVEVQLTVCKNADELTSVKADVVHSGSAFNVTEQLIKDKKLYELNNVLASTIPGETVTVADKIEDGFLDSSLTMPYGDGKTYLAPVFYSPYGLFYNAGMFSEKRWEVPGTWDEMWVLADTALDEGIYLFSYPTTEHLESFMCALIYSIGGPDFYNAVAAGDEGVWDTKEARNLTKILEKLAKYTHPATASQANSQSYTKNQLLIMENEAIFMPNSTYVTSEMLMEEQSFTHNFGWGMTTLPAASVDSAAYSYCTIEQIWIPADAEKKSEAEQFIAFLYSDEAAKLFAAKGAIQPIKNSSSIVDSSAKRYYSLFDNGAKAALGGSAANSVLADSFGKLVDGTIKAGELLTTVKAAGAQ